MWFPLTHPLHVIIEPCNIGAVRVLVLYRKLLLQQRRTTGRESSSVWLSFQKTLEVTPSTRAVPFSPKMILNDFWKLQPRINWLIWSLLYRFINTVIIITDMSLLEIMLIYHVTIINNAYLPVNSSTKVDSVNREVETRMVRTEL